jgi:exonuclease VII small subunit
MYPEEARKVSGKSTNPLIPSLDDQLERLEKIIEHLHQRLEGVLSTYDTGERLSHPQAEPSSALRGRVERLQDLNTALDALIGRIDL